MFAMMMMMMCDVQCAWVYADCIRRRMNERWKCAAVKWICSAAIKVAYVVLYTTTHTHCTRRRRHTTCIFDMRFAAAAATVCCCITIINNNIKFFVCFAPYLVLFSTVGAIDFNYPQFVVVVSILYAICVYPNKDNHGKLIFIYYFFFLVFRVCVNV